MEKRKIGERYAQELGVRGAKELAQILPAFPDSVRAVGASGLSPRDNEKDAAVEKPKDAAAEKPKDAAAEQSQDATAEKPKDAYQEWLDQRAKETAERAPANEERGWDR